MLRWAATSLLVSATALHAQQEGKVTVADSMVVLRGNTVRILTLHGDTERELQLNTSFGELSQVRFEHRSSLNGVEDVSKGTAFFITLHNAVDTVLVVDAIMLEHGDTLGSSSFSYAVRDTRLRAFWTQDDGANGVVFAHALPPGKAITGVKAWGHETPQLLDKVYGFDLCFTTGDGQERCFRNRGGKFSFGNKRRFRKFSAGRINARRIDIRSTGGYRYPVTEPLELLR